MEPGGSLPCSQESSTGMHSHIKASKDIFGKPKYNANINDLGGKK
jgi:hypothetical protein